ncbi:hypothetical protein SAMN04487948_10383 [Halogranum amylolyticum]|uniref:Uncharacterized protein n=1 Tax=Halogranum amylolyticum TaxID=660520 RepID=A0A1H8QEV5_9EURY|nr:hypothetical protein [Halogranum amylolyticum]SEO52769.1 hypothetical protein SAMN04487948_10383 [Halogranum amylolyticum]
MFSLHPPSIHPLALALAVVTFLATTVERFLWELADVRVVLGVGVEPVARIVLAVVAVVTLSTIGWQALTGRGLRAAAIVLAGPLVGVGAFLVLHWLVFGPSTDSPTWLVYLALCAGAAVAGSVVYGVGLTLRWGRNRAVESRRP